ncbi:MAG: cardiolipin synthase B [Ectothiorhodospiraceae bacterium]|nr:cardiolipin synthase B [Ectothiorhodospiraceae bacterium]
MTKQIFYEGDALYADMLRAIACARQRVWMESYIFAGDRVGRRFAAALARAARRGLDVRLHIDAAGSLFLFPRRLQQRLRRAGVRVRRFHRWSWRDPWRYNRRNHCKLLIVDRAHVYLGGFNIHEQSSRRYHGDGRWRDTHVRLDSAPLSDQGADLFALFWTRRVPARLRRPPPPDLLAGDMLVTNRLPRHRHALRYLLRLGLHRAQHRVSLTTPYFAPDPLTARHLVDAARRVELRLLLPARSDVRLLELTARHLYARFLKAGVRIFEYVPRTLHAKTMVADADWASIGSANLDFRSFLHNYEIHYVTTDPRVCGDLQAQFERDLCQAREITLESLGRRPCWERVAGWLGWQFRWWL